MTPASQGAIQYCLKEGAIDSESLDYIGYYEKPLRKFARLLETYLTFAPAAFASFKQAAAGRMTSGDERRLTAALLDKIKPMCEERGILFCLLNTPASYDMDGNVPRELLTSVSPEEIVDVPAIIKERMKTEMYWTRSDGY